MSDVIRLSDAHPAQAAIVLTEGAIGLHAGIFFHTSDQLCRVLHLAFHYRLQCDDSLSGWAYVVPRIDPVNLAVLAGFCALLDRTRPLIPYGFEFRSARFDEDGRFIPGPGESGLTCTTFVMAIFDRARVPLLARDTWQDRQEDADAQRILVEHLRRNATPQHVAAVESEVGCARYRCEEVAAASSITPRPVAFEVAAPAGQEIRAAFDDCVAMRVAIIGWGSLIWKPRGLRLKSAWSSGGPSLQIEFSRVSSDGRLTLVVDTAAGVAAPTRFALGEYSSLEEAILGLMEREGTVRSKIGFIDLQTGMMNARETTVADAIRSWAAEHRLDAAVWTDLEPNFQSVRNAPFSADAAVQYVMDLAGETAQRALEYIDNAPPDVQTPVRERIARARARRP